MAFNGPPITVRLPLSVDAAVRTRAADTGVTPARVVVAAVISSFERGGARATVTVTAPVGLIAALENAGALVVGARDSGHVSDPMAGQVSEPADPRVPEHLAARVERAARRQREAERVPSQDELDAKGGVGEVAGCEHKHSVAVGALRRCAVCNAFRGLDGVWRAG